MHLNCMLETYKNRKGGNQDLKSKIIIIMMNNENWIKYTHLQYFVFKIC